MTWWQALPAICIAATLFFVPGFVLARGLGARGFFSTAMAPLASCGVIGVSGIIGGVTHISWSIWLVAGVTIACTAAGWFLRLLFRDKLLPVARSSGGPVLSWATVLLVLGTSAPMVAKKLLPAMGTPDSFAQVYDNIFHLNAIRYIIETGNASSLTLGNMSTGRSGISIYPSVWHSLSALVAQLASVNVFVAENAVTIAVTALVWPFACIALVRGVIGPKIIATVVAGILSTSFWVFPFQIIQWGPLFPNTLAYSILPIAVLLLASAFGLTRERMADPFTVVTLFAVSVAAMFLTQPNGFSAMLAFSVPMVLGLWIRTLIQSLRSENRTQNVLLTLAWGLAALVTFVIIWKALLLGYDDWKPSRSLGEAVKDVATGGLLGRNFTWLASMFAAVGLLVILIKRRGWWMIACMAVAGGLYVTAVWAPMGAFRHTITGSWYQDPYRLAALVPLFTIVLASVGADGLAIGVGSLLKRLALRFGGRAASLSQKPSAALQSIAGLLVLVLGLAVMVPLTLQTNQKGMKMITKKISQSWSYKPGWIVSSPEYILMSRLDSEVPPNAVIAVDPFNGGSLAYAISGRKVTQYHLNPSPSKDLLLVAQNLATASHGSETCKLANELNIRFVLDFGSFYMLDVPAAKKYPGFVEIQNAPALKLIDQQDHAKLYEVVGC
ncbi:DUF6541 family protein [Arthrobacter psychrochitiniphilus]|uniref:Uncharacterized protein n=1 Tax=Arthrobacter psychrochitiniphilus TaxID=291045 RepID=A0A2V3DWD7_9MICC|nr:DUF6541 family protein [Arthrobacter psychrochitiniphilus]NYG18323.1 hypothetical protein [Arthrobacter psychrochitiniphilus]PXA64898.1 hypothetical protein CVS29_11885 [Arthrobacter psychrochitiniphilus]